MSSGPDRSRPENNSAGQKALRAELVERAAALVPMLRANAARAEAARRLPDENIAALEKAGFFRLRTPKRFGGLEADMRTYNDVVAELARGCGSTGWIAFISNASIWVASHFPEEALTEVFGPNPDTRFIGLLAMTSTAKAEDGGYIVNGRWSFASNCLHAHWAMLAVPLPTKDGGMEPGLALMPMSDMTIEDTWYFAAMRGTGSNTVVAKDVRVPAHRTMPLGRLLAENEIGQDAHGLSYREAFSAVAILMVAAPVVGLARAALELTLERVNGNPPKRISYSFYEDLRKAPSMQLLLAEAKSQIETSAMVIERWCDDLAEAARDGKPMSFTARAQMRVDMGQAMRGCREGVNKLLSVQGASAFAESNPLQRIWRDIEFASRHGLLAPEVPMEILGRALVGDFEMLSPLV